MDLRRARLNRRATGPGAALAAAALVGGSVIGVATGVVPFEPVRVPTDSMAPTLQAGDHLLLDHRAAPVVRGDIVVVPDPADGTLLVKRVVALGGQSVGLDGGILTVDGTPVAEPYADLAPVGSVWFGPVDVPPGEVFVLGDNRDDSVDSRHFGSLPAASVVGHVTVRLWPRPGPV